MQANFRHGIRVVTMVLWLAILDACNGGAGQAASTGISSLKSADQALSRNREGKINLNWMVDNLVKPQDLNSSLKDLGWHIVTLSVSSVDGSSFATPVEGLLAGIYPTPPLQRGQRILIQDINCATAVFSQVGDSCSAYFKLDYDGSNGSNDPVPFPVDIEPKGKLKAALTFIASYQPSTSITDYRAINAFESQYYSASALVANKNAYQIYLVQNGSTPAVNLTTLQAPLNPIFRLMHRRGAGAHDPYYGNQIECSLKNNPALRQSNQLANLNESCILVYNAAATATNTSESELISLASDSANSFPYWANRYNLVANYVNGTTLPDILITAASATLHEALPFNNFILSYNFTPLLPILPGSHSGRLILPDGTNIWNGETILSSNGTPVVITNIVPEFPDGTLVSIGNTSVKACGGTYATANAAAVAYTDVTRRGGVQINLDMNSSGHCGAPAPAYFSANIPLNGYSNTIYHIDDSGCDGGHWDMGGTVTLNGGCDPNFCNYTIAVTAHHGGVGNECQETKTNAFMLSFAKPTTNHFAYLNSADANPISFAAAGGQNSGGSIGGSALAPISQSITCDTTNTCSATGTFSNGLASQDMAYQINLNPEDVLNNGAIQFTRSSGYDLNNFNIQIASAPGMSIRTAIKKTNVFN